MPFDPKTAKAFDPKTARPFNPENAKPTPQSVPPIVDYAQRVIQAQLAPAQRIYSQVIPQFQQGNPVAGTFNAINALTQAGMAGLAPITELPGVKQFNEGILGPMLSKLGGAAIEGAAQPLRAAGVPGVLRATVPYSSYPSPQTRKDISQATNETVSGLLPSLIMSTAPGVVGEIAKGVIPKDLPVDMYSKAVKPPYTRKFGISGSDKVAQTGLKEGIPVSRGGLAKAYGIISELNGKVNDVIAQSQAAGNKVSVPDVLKSLEGLKEQYSYGVNGADHVAMLDQLAKNFSDNPHVKNGLIDVADAQKMKIETYKQVAKSYGEQTRFAAVEGQKQIARGLKDEIAKFYPELNKINAREGAMIDFTDALEKRVAMLTKANPSFFRPMMEGGVIGTATGNVTLGGLAALVDKVFNNPYMKSKLAIVLEKARTANPQPKFRPVPVEQNANNQ